METNEGRRTKRYSATAREAQRPHPRAQTHANTQKSASAASQPSGVKPAFVHKDLQKVAFGHEQSSRAAKVLGAVAACVVVAMALGFCYLTMWRSIPVTVNGQELEVHVGTNLADLLEDNDYFGVQAGRLLSIGGNVLDEQGGDRAAVRVGDQPVACADLASTKVEEGEQLTVENGADVTEDHTEEQATVAPQVQMETGGAIQYVRQWGRAGQKTVWRGAQSGEVIDHEVTTPAQDMIVTSVNPAPKGGKCMALTFDDGPSKYTQAILDILKEKGATATFFNLGTQAAASPDLCKAVLDGGNELASHTNQHQNLPSLDRDALRNEISSAFDTLEQASGERLQMIRAPYGAFTATEWGRSADLISCNVLWNIDTLDWKRPGAEAIKNEVLKHARNGAIVLMHDGGGNREQDVEALPGIIDALHDAGYELVTVSELMRRDGSIPEDVIDGTVKAPEDAAFPE